VLVRLADADERCGAKATNLSRLLRAGFSVCDGFVIPDPQDGRWERDLEPALRSLGGGRFAVRSSALGEDGTEASFAGQMHTTLQVTAAEVAAAVRRTAASGSGAAAYVARMGRRAETVVPVIVQRMLEVQASGVAFTRHPISGAGEVVIEATAGLGDVLVNGAVAPERWTLDGVVCAAGVLTAVQARALAATARRVEALFGCPQDIEWAIAAGRVWLLQARPITTTPRHDETVASAGGVVLASGTAASPGTAAGPVRVIADLDDFDRFRAGDVLVCRATSPAWTPLLARAAAVVAETGGMLAHAAIVAREFAVPAVMAVPDATRSLTEGQRVVVDGTAGTVATTAAAR
jgi:pyruvate,water dikinase